MIILKIIGMFLVTTLLVPFALLRKLSRWTLSFLNKIVYYGIKTIEFIYGKDKCSTYYFKASIEMEEKKELTKFH